MPDKDNEDVMRDSGTASMAPYRIVQINCTNYGFEAYRRLCSGAEPASDFTEKALSLRYENDTGKVFGYLVYDMNAWERRGHFVNALKYLAKELPLDEIVVIGAMRETLVGLDPYLGTLPLERLPLLDDVFPEAVADAGKPECNQDDLDGQRREASHGMAPYLVYDATETIQGVVPLISAGGLRQQPKDSNGIFELYREVYDSGLQRELRNRRDPSTSSLVMCLTSKAPRNLGAHLYERLQVEYLIIAEMEKRTILNRYKGRMDDIPENWRENLYSEELFSVLANGELETPTVEKMLPKWYSSYRWFSKEDTREFAKDAAWHLRRLPDEGALVAEMDSDVAGYIEAVNKWSERFNGVLDIWDHFTRYGMLGVMDLYEMATRYRKNPEAFLKQTKEIGECLGIMAAVSTYLYGVPMEDVLA